jgi:predicted RNA-binding protein with PIN domain
VSDDAATTPLPDAVRSRVVDLADAELGATPASAANDLPAALRAFRSFAPAKRRRAAAAALAAALESDEAFRASVARRARDQHADLASALDAGTVPPAADPVDVAVVAYLLRSEGWADRVAMAGSVAGERADAAEVQAVRAQVEALTREVTTVRDKARAKERDLTAAAEKLRAENAQLRGSVRESEEAARKAEERARTAEGRLAAVEAKAAEAAREAERREKRLRDTTTGVERELEALRQRGREERAADDLRLGLLVDTLVDAAAGLRRELALPASTGSPGDALGTGAGDAARAAVVGDVKTLDARLRLPRAHLIVDGYNVTKTHFGQLTLEEQRTRLVNDLGGVAARTSAEVTVVFDGRDLDPPPPTSRVRNVRVDYSRAPQIADQRIAEYLAAEPSGRAVLVVSDDREVQASARGFGFAYVPTALLVALLTR